MKSHLAALLVLSAAPPATALAQPAGPRPGPAEAAAAGETLTPHEAQVRRAAAIKSGDKAAIAKATADEDAAFARWRRDHPAAAAVTPASKAASEASAREAARKRTDDTSPSAEQAERREALKSGDKAAIAKAGADEDAAFAKWPRHHPAATAVTPKSKAAHQAELARLRAKQKTHAQP